MSEENSQRWKLVEEVFATEVTYVECLEVLAEVRKEKRKRKKWKENKSDPH
jgi:hypothetical protein